MIAAQRPGASGSGRGKGHLSAAVALVQLIHEPHQLDPARVVWLMEQGGLHGGGWMQVEADHAGFFVAEPRLVDASEAVHRRADEARRVGRRHRQADGVRAVVLGAAHKTDPELR